MEKFKINLSTVFGCIGLALFGLAALASSSSQDAVKAFDDFNDGWQEGKKYRNDIDDIHYESIDSIANDKPSIS